MNRQDTLGILSVIQAAYPNQFKGISKSKADDIISVWAGMLADYEPAEVAVAVKSYIAANDTGFAPSPGQIISMIQSNRGRGDELTEMEAWALVEKATRSAGWYAREEFDKLPEAVREIVGSPTQLREWALMPSDELKTVVASNFQRSYRAKVKRNREVAALPSDIRQQINLLAEGVKAMPQALPWEVQK